MNTFFFAKKKTLSVTRTISGKWFGRKELNSSIACSPSVNLSSIPSKKKKKHDILELWGRFFFFSITDTEEFTKWIWCRKKQGRIHNQGACGWAGVLFKRLAKYLGRSSNAKPPINAEIAKCYRPIVRPSDRPT